MHGNNQMLEIPGRWEANAGVECAIRYSTISGKRKNALRVGDDVEDLPDRIMACCAYSPRVLSQLCVKGKELWYLSTLFQREYILPCGLYEKQRWYCPRKDLRGEIPSQRSATSKTRFTYRAEHRAGARSNTTLEDFMTRHFALYLAEWANNGCSHVIYGIDLRSQAQPPTYHSPSVPIFTAPIALREFVPYLDESNVDEEALGRIEWAISSSAKYIARWLCAACEVWFPAKHALRILSSFMPELDVAVLSAAAD